MQQTKRRNTGPSSTVVDAVLERANLTTARLGATFLLEPDFLDGVSPPCREVDPEIFFPLDSASGDEAKAVCHTCPVEVQCGDWATVRGISDGIWGGLSPKQRKARRRLGVVTR